MSILGIIYRTFLDAIFPVSPAERDVMSMDGKRAWRELPRARNFPTAEACSVFSYKDERVRRLIWAIKYKKSAQGASIAGHVLHHVLRIYASAAPGVTVVPMPITGRRRRERGYNQCEFMADVIAGLEKAGRGSLVGEYSETKDKDIGSAAGSVRLTVARGLLVRKRHASRQTLKNRLERLETADDIFAVDPAYIREMKKIEPIRDPDDQWMKNHFVVVIDDVVTTGSTMAGAVRVLRLAGFPNVFGLSVAH